MQRIRAARSIAEYYKEIDPGTMVIETMIRRLVVKDGDVDEA